MSPAWKAFPLLFACCVISAEASTDPCPCAKDVGDRISLLGPTSDGGFPDPSVVSIARMGGKRIIRIRSKVQNTEDLTYVLLSSTDEGLTWRNEGEYEWAASARSNPLVLYSYRGGCELFWRSSDGGLHWTMPSYTIEGRPKQGFVRKVSGRSDAGLHVQIAGLHPRDPATVYATFHVWVNSPRVHAKYIEVEKTFDVPGMYVSYDGGDHWSRYSQTVGNVSDDADATPAIGISAFDPNIVMAQAAAGVVRSSDGGMTWVPVGQQAELNRHAELVGRSEVLSEIRKKNPTFHPPVPEWLNLHLLQIVFRPDSAKTVYLVTNKGLFRSVDGGDSWRLLDMGVRRISGIGELTVDPEKPARIYVGTQEAIMVSDDEGCHFRKFFDPRKALKTAPQAKQHPSP